LNAAYQAANFLGVPLGFTPAPQLAQLRPGPAVPRGLRQAKAVVCADVTHLPAGAAAALAELARRGIEVVILGAPPKLDPYGQPYTDPTNLPAPQSLDQTDEKALFHWFVEHAKKWKLRRPVLLTTADGLPAYGVECRSAREKDGRTIVSLCNHRRETQTITLTCTGRPTTGVDLISGRRLGPKLKIAPMIPMLLHIPNNGAL
jgi:hypothetical protein